MAHRHTRGRAIVTCIILIIMLGVAAVVPVPAFAGDAALALVTSPATQRIDLALVGGTRIDLALVGGTLIDGSGGPPLKDAVVMIRGDRIVAVGQAGRLRVPAGTPTRNLRGRTMLPGLINAHVHISKLSDDALRGWTRVGITTVRDLAGAPRPLLARRQALAASKNAAYPRLLVAGPFITVPGGHPIPRNGLSDEVIAVQGVADARKQVTALLDAGVDLIKIVVSGRTDVHWSELSNAEIAAVTATAHARDVRVTAHVDRASALRRAVENGIDDAAHMPRDRMPDDLIALMVRRNVALVPTINVNVYEDLAESRGLGVDWHRWTLPVMQDNLRRFAAAGGTLALGDDYGGIEGMALGMPMTEIQHWLGAGLTPMQVLVAATRGSALVSGLAGEIGQVRPGMRADLLIVDGDPLRDMTALTRTALVVNGGIIVTR